MILTRDDTVRVISGADKGKDGKIIKIYTNTNKALVQGVNLKWKHMKKSSNYPHGARIQKESPILMAKLMILCSSCNKPTRVSYVKTETGLKNRVCKKCKQTIKIG